MAGSQTLLWQEVKHSYGRKSNTLMAGRQTLSWQEGKHSYGRKAKPLMAGRFGTGTNMWLGLTSCMYFFFFIVLFNIK
jgi:hypothetical protein